MTQEKAVPEDFLGIRTKREALGMTLKDVFALTRISTANLEAIENGDFHNLPVPIYTKNFIKTYARALELDSKPILDSYQGYLNSQQIAQTQITEAAPEKEQETSSERPPHFKAYIAAAAIVIAVIVVTIIIIYQQNQLVPDAPLKPPPPAMPVQPTAAVNTQGNLPVQPLPGPSATQPQTVVQPVAAPPTNQMQTPAALPVKQTVVSLPTPAKQSVPAVDKKEQVTISKGTDILMIKATEETWLRIKIDQNPVFEVLLKPGEQIIRKGAAFEVDIGNAGGVTMKFNEKIMGNLGKSGQVIHLQLPQ